MIHSRSAFLLLLFAATYAAAQSQPYREAPMLAGRVATGGLPPVHQRLPENPPVVTPIESIGRYGGYWRRFCSTPGDMGLSSRLGYETLVRWDQTGQNVIPNLAERYDVLDGGRTFIFHLRKGLHWSDGHPFTSEDFVFAYEDFVLNRELMALPPAHLQVNDQIYRLEAPDPYTVIFRFEHPYGLFPEVLAFRGRQGHLFLPRHYLMQFHSRYTDIASLNALARSRGLLHWRSLFSEVMNLEKNPDCPTMGPFVLRIAFPDQRPLAERNAYYWKVDPEGHQLPYLDGIAYTTVFDRIMLNLKTINGEADFQDRHIDSGNYTLFMEQRQAGNYRVLADYSNAPTCVFINQHSLNDEMRPLLQDRRFRIALSLAINRQELVEMIFTGLAIPANGGLYPGDLYYVENNDQMYTEYDPVEANRLLDELGMKRGLDGMRRLPSGRPFRQVLNIYPSETGSNSDMWQLLCDYWREVGLSFVPKHDDGPLSVLQVTSGQIDFWAYYIDGLHWNLDGVSRVPLAPTSYYAPMYGRYFSSKGNSGVAPPPEHQQLVEWYQRMRGTPDPHERLDMGRRISRQWAEQTYVIGLCRPMLLTIVSNRFRNVPENIIHEWTLMSPGYIGIEQFYIDE